MRICHPPLTLMALLMLLASVGLSSGCGQKGALYHPADSQQTIDKNKATKTRPKP